MSGVSGSFSQLRVIMQRVAPERLEQVKRSLIGNLAQEARTQIALGFEQGRAPDGTSWKPLAHKRARDKRGSKGIPLNDTGRLKNSWTVSIQANGFTWTSNVEYAPPHQFGAHIAPHSRVRGRYQAVNRKGQFRKHSGITGKSARVRHLSRGTWANGITIPARPMIPIGTLPPLWQRPFDAVVKRTLVGYWLA